MKKYLLTFCTIVITSVSSYAQPGCPNVDAGPDLDIDCYTTCADMIATYLHTGESTSYAVSSVTYSPPFPFTGGTSLFIGIDDVFSNAIPLPFDFCFYGTPYNQMVVGANGVISFDMANAGGFCAWSFSASIPTPVSIYNNSINGAYHDIDPSVGFTADINYTILGSPPCRMLVVNYANVPQFSCNSLITTQQIVLYETTNVIEVYIQDKPVCASWNSGNAVIGLQNATGTVGITPPGRNTGLWAATNEAWRFTPNGPPNVVLNWYDGAGNLIGVGDTMTMCPVDTTMYHVQAVYTNCNGSAIIAEDSVQVNYTSTTVISGIIVSQTPADCGVNNGSVTISGTGGVPPYTYDIGSGPQLSGTFTGLASGNYNIVVRDTSGCGGSVPFTITDTSAIGISVVNIIDEYCGLANGSIEVSTTGGFGTYSYDIGSGAQTSPIFTGLTQGLYTITVTDSVGCMSSITDTVGATAGAITGNVVSQQPSHCGAADGSITVSGSGGFTPYTYDIGSGSQLSGTFTGLSLGNYNIIIQDSAGCSQTFPVTITDTSTIAISIVNVVDENCGLFNGSIEVLATGGFGTYLYDVGTGTQTSPILSGLSTGSYTITVTDSIGCTTSVNGTVGIIYGTLDLGPDRVSCEDVLITANTGGPFLWSTGDTSQTITNSLSGTYFVIAGVPGCQLMDTISVVIMPLINKYIPNVFSPNSDGINDTFVFSIPNETSFKLQIFNRWGKEMFTSNDITYSWDGKVNGKDVPDGVYFWTLKYIDPCEGVDEQTLSGVVEVLR